MSDPAPKPSGRAGPGLVPGARAELGGPAGTALHCGRPRPRQLKRARRPSHTAYNKGVPGVSSLQVIRSRHNEQVKKLRQALRRGQRTPEGLVAIETFHLLQEALQSALPVPQVFCTGEAEERVRSLLEEHAAQPQMFRLAANVFQSVSATRAAQGVAALVRPRAWTLDDLFAPAPALVLLLAGLQDPGNAGTILRTAEAFAATGAMLLEGTVRPQNPKLLRASAGSAFRLPLLDGLRPEEALEALRARRIPLYAAVPRAPCTLEELDLRRPLALAIGAEGAGVPPALLAQAEPVSVPHAPRVDSLNAAVAAAIFLYSAARARTPSEPRP